MHEHLIEKPEKRFRPPCAVRYIMQRRVKRVNPDFPDFRILGASGASALH
jgi:hypothetical protein